MIMPAPFAYSPAAHARRHAPAGYKDYREYKPWLRDEFEFRCVYCLQRERWSRERDAIFSVEHVIPRSEDPDGRLICEYDNLLYACTRCNSARQDIRVLDPTAVAMGEHLRVDLDGRIFGLTEDGGFLIDLLHLNANEAVTERRRVFRILKRVLQSPDDEVARIDFLDAFGYPGNLPDLRELRPPEGNRLSANAERCFFALRSSGQLAETY
jgi:hypothetical protein